MVLCVVMRCGAMRCDRGVGVVWVWVWCEVGWRDVGPCATSIRWKVVFSRAARTHARSPTRTLGLLPASLIDRVDEMVAEFRKTQQRADELEDLLLKVCTVCAWRLHILR